MSEHGLAPNEIKQKYTAEISEASTFKTHGVSEKAAIAYLKTPEGELFWKTLVKADPAASIDKISDRAIDQIKSGRDLPRMEIISEPLVKIVPVGEGVHSKSPYFAKLSEYEDAIAKGHNLSERFGLPIKSEAQIYDVYDIRPNRLLKNSPQSVSALPSFR